jgi:anti-sigma factor RsiW
MPSEEHRQQIPDLLLEQHRLGELGAEDARRLDGLLAATPSLRLRIETLDRDDEEFARRYPSQWLAQRIRARAASRADAPPRDGRPSLRWGIPLALSAATLLLVLAIPQSYVLQRETSASVDGPDRIKGRPTLAVFRRTDHGSETLADGTIARAGDLVRLGYTGGGRAYGVILSIDGRGAVTMHLPPNGGRAAALRSGRTILLDQAYELDDAPGWERFYFVTSDASFEVAPIVAAARQAAGGDRSTPPGPLPIASRFDQSMFLLEKEVRP